MLLVYMFAGAALGLLITIVSGLMRGNTVLSSLARLAADRMKRLSALIGEREPSVMNDDTNVAAATQDVVSSAAYEQDPLRILAVDDDPFILSLIPNIAGNAGFADITVASSAEAALDLIVASEIPFDCFVLDIRMPGMDGIDLCARVREDAAYKDAPIIMLTVMKDIEHLERAFKAGATDYATKPFEITEFGNRLSALAQHCHVLRRNHMADASEAMKRNSEDLKPELFDDMVIGSLHNLISHRSIRNYLQQLSAFSASDARVRAVKIDQFDLISQKKNAPQCFAFLSDAGESIGEVFTAKKFAMAYSGNGVFILVSNQDVGMEAEDLEDEIQAILNSRSSELGVELDIKFSVSVGASIQPEIRVSSRADKAIFYAICNAEARLASKMSYRETYA
ncbi:response regulator [Thioclava indica]|uniref:Response regulatory domain-containing protein n=1 Tax=Thioclava indica TaxID=1353528 RepID=A0A074J754_9RHOB|nr:response regulator [Thioclava indica]KEO53341.1 hypothetical protein DT23_18550 [Thioclava indica]